MPRLPHIPLAALGPVALVSLLVLLVFWRPAAPGVILPPPSAFQPMAAPERQRAPGEPTPTPAPLVGQYARRADLEIVSARGLFTPEEKERLAGELERALAYVSERFGSGPKAKFSAYFGLEPGCGLHGIAYTAERTAQVFTCPDIPRARAVNIMAHEFVHQLAHDRYGDAHLSADMILLEGLATWGAGDYWLGGAPSFANMVQPWVISGRTLPLATSYVGRPIGDMNMLYYQWASFVEFLIQVYGRASFDALYVTGGSSPGSADYLGIYGKRLDQLEQEWEAWVAG